MAVDIESLVVVGDRKADKVHVRGIGNPHPPATQPGSPQDGPVFRVCTDDGVGTGRPSRAEDIDGLVIRAVFDIERIASREASDTIGHRTPGGGFAAVGWSIRAGRAAGIIDVVGCAGRYVTIEQEIKNIEGVQKRRDLRSCCAHQG